MEMMDEEDSDILDDIKALENALTLNPQFSICDPSDDDDNADYSFSIQPSEEANLSTTGLENDSDNFYDTINEAIEANLCLVEAYKVALEVINSRLEKCIKRQQEVDYQIQLMTRGCKINWKIPFLKAGHPYFKDENLFGAPPNDDQLMKQRRDEFTIVYSRLPNIWSSKGRAKLYKAARVDASSKYLEIMKSANRNNENAADMDYLVPSDFTYVLKTLGNIELDWMKISVKDMNNRFSSHACKAMWNLYLSPVNNHRKWTKEEDNKLRSLAVTNKYQNWDSIAEQLGTGRTCYQCFVRYNTINPPSTINADMPWAPDEDKFVTELINTLKIGDIIPWSLVTFYLGSRTKNQIYCHWRYNLNPILKKGRFTLDEDQKLLNAANKYGQNFPRIAAECFPHRTTVQLNTRFHLLMLKTNESYNSWTLAEDKRLLALYSEFGNNWSVIGNIMNKDRTYVRHHHAALTRQLSKGNKLADVRRKRNDNNVNDSDDVEEVVNDNIDVKLMRYFQNIPKTAPRPGKKRKYHTAEELETKTQQIRDIFQKLNVNIEIPDDLDDMEGLTIMDKELLRSLKKSNHPSTSKYTREQIEQYRLKMFCTNKLDEDDDSDDQKEKFIPPAPFGLFQNIRKRATSKKNSSNTICDDCNIELIMNLQTPENILEMLKEEEIEVFDKLTELIIGNCEIVQHSKKFEKKYIPPIATIQNDSSQNVNLRTKVSDIFELETDPTEGMNNVFIEPCYSTLRGYQCLLGIKKKLNKQPGDNFSLNETMISKKSREALRLLKSRCLTLFKYPIGMAHFPIDHKKLIGDVNDRDDNEDPNETQMSTSSEASENMSIPDEMDIIDNIKIE